MLLLTRLVLEELYVWDDGFDLLYFALLEDKQKVKCGGV
jgi:hypothetical protein